MNEIEQKAVRKDGDATMCDLLDKEISELTQQKEIEEMARYIVRVAGIDVYGKAEYLLNAGYRNCKDKVILDKEEYEKIKSLYDTQKGAIMTSSIGDLPLTVEGLRKVVDEITRLINVQTELQELNAKYYNEAKDLRRKLAQVRRETARQIYKKGKERDENFDMTGLGEYIMANFMAECKCNKEK